MKSVTGSLQIKNNKYYAVINLYDQNGKRKVKWVSLGLEARGNKREAQAMLRKVQEEYSNGELMNQAFTGKGKLANSISDISVYDFVKEWLERHKVNIEKITYHHYELQVEGRVKSYFSNIRLGEVTGDDLNDFYSLILAEGCKANTAIHYHAMLRNAFQQAVKRGILATNPCEKADRPKKNQFIPDYYSSEELKLLLDITDDDPMRIVIILAAYYGLRRSEALGVKWSAIDFAERKITINHKVVEEKVNGKYVPVGYSNMKTKSSYRTLPLIPAVEEALLLEREKQELMKKVMRKAYSKAYTDYVCVDRLGVLMRPNYVTEHFSNILKSHNLKKIRFHDLRHTCASVMLANGVQMKQIQDWLGHSTFATTADIYAHLDFKSKEVSAQVMGEVLQG